MASRIISGAAYWLRMALAQTVWVAMVLPFILLELACRLFNYLNNARWVNAYADFCRRVVAPIAPRKRRRNRKIR